MTTRRRVSTWMAGLLFLGLNGAGWADELRDPSQPPVEFLPRVEAVSTAEGLPGMRIEELTLTGLMGGGFGPVALLLGKDKKVYTAKVNQPLANGRLLRIEKDCIVFEKTMHNEFGQKIPPVEVVLKLRR